ncbi:nuclear factor 7, ovary-like [Spea bombifrons]|uniref:nuclear factor 7, ovary-like n=1 Tax=Spea bombifrons TaxID=233779 RepID=UPI00234AA6AE|nr:nuclear factor 7, ovary-like [Spea bombifrons]
MAASDLQDELSCSVCLNIYTDPVTLPCGHNFCRVCLENVLDSQERSGVFSCPECRAEHLERPALQNNRKLRNIAERFHVMCPEPEGSERLCSNVTPGKPVSIAPTYPDRKCLIHDKILEYYCLQDAVCVCVSCCLIGEHRGHQVETSEMAAEKKKEELRGFLENLKSEREGSEKNVQSLEVCRKEIQEKADGVTDRVTALILDIKEQVGTLESRVLSEISRQKEMAFTQISDLILQLQLGNEELSKKMRQTEELLNSENPLDVLEGQQPSSTICDHEAAGGSSNGRADKEASAPKHIDEILISIILERGLHNLADNLPILRARRGFSVEEASDILLDVDTAVTDVAVSDNLKILTTCRRHWHGQEESDKYAMSQVLSNKSFSSGQHYWELETSEWGNWRIGVAYIGDKMQGLYYRIGSNDKSWCLWKWNRFSSLRHNAEQKYVHLEPSTHRYGIFLDYEAGQLSFYQLCDPIRHLHTFTAKFTEPLYAAFHVYMDGWLRICS